MSEWPNSQSAIDVPKAMLLAVGRTSLLEPMVSHEEVDEIAEEWGRDYYSAALPVSQRLDLIATMILSKDRAARNPKTHAERKDYLSEGQYWQRLQREELRAPERFNGLEDIAIFRGRGPEEQAQFRKTTGWVRWHTQSRAGGCEVIEDGERCGAQISGGRMCSKHRRRFLRHGDPLVVKVKTKKVA